MALIRICAEPLAYLSTNLEEESGVFCKFNDPFFDDQLHENQTFFLVKSSYRCGDLFCKNKFFKAGILGPNTHKELFF